MKNVEILVLEFVRDLGRIGMLGGQLVLLVLSCWDRRGDFSTSIIASVVNFVCLEEEMLEVRLAARISKTCSY
jgi:hypothetical protein